MNGLTKFLIIGAVLVGIGAILSQRNKRLPPPPPQNPPLGVNGSPYTFTATGATVAVQNTTTSPVDGKLSFIVHNSLGQTVAIGSDALTTIPAGGVVTLSTSFSPALATGNYLATYYMVDANDGVISNEVSGFSESV